MTPSKVADLTIDEFRDAGTCHTNAQKCCDPDEGLELRDDFAEELLGSLAAVEAGGKTTSAQKVAEKLGLTW